MKSTHHWSRQSWLTNCQLYNEATVDPVPHNSGGKRQDDSPVTPVERGQYKKGEDRRDPLSVEGDVWALNVSEGPH